MAHTEKCRGCMYENACDYVDCRFDENKRIYNQALDKLDEIITEQLDQSDNQIECQTLRWVLDKISELIK